MSNEALVENIQRLKKERNAVILAHNYQIGEVQDIADFTGDSLGLSQQAAETEADVIVFCGVLFMAETAAILSPEKTVLLPEVNAGCPMADMITAEQLREKKKEYPGSPVVCYVNSTAAVKAESDVCCTSSNAIKIVKQIDDDPPILFVPDKYLGMYAASKTKKNLVFWEGHCPIHMQVTAEDLIAQKKEHPAAETMVHPECRPEAIAEADAALSTGGILKRARESNAKEFIIGTEIGILHPLQKENPDKVFYPATEKAVCRDMKTITLEKVLWSLENMKHRIMVPADIREKAVRAVDRMLELS